MISIVIPVLNEEHNPIFKKTLKLLSSFNGLQVICVDGESQDRTQDFISSYSNVKFVASTKKTRAGRINIGIDKSQFDMILLHHPRSLLTVQAINKLVALKDKPVWGGFKHCFDVSHPLLKFTSWYSNYIRFKYKRIVYLDHCIFFHKKLLANYRLPEVEIFEDTLLSEHLKKFSHPILLDGPAKTSAIRFTKNGIYRQATLNQMLKLGFFLKLSDQGMNRLYEKGLGLNTKHGGK